MTKKRVLGRGLSALLENADTDLTTNNVGVAGGQSVGSISAIRINQIGANPFNPRTNFEDHALNELADSIKTHGIIQPLTVRKLGRDKYQLISGERRFRASQIAGLTEVPCYIRIADDQTMLEMALVENIQREDLNSIEVALSYERLIQECNITQEQLSEKLGKSRSNITNFLRLLKLPPAIQIGIRESLISMGHARALVSAGDESKQLNLFKAIIADKLSVRDLEKLIKEDKSVGVKNGNAASSGASFAFSKAENDFKEQLSNQLKTKVQLNANNKGKGKIVINFDSQKQLDQIIDLIG